MANVAVVTKANALTMKENVINHFLEVIAENENDLQQMLDTVIWESENKLYENHGRHKE